MALVDRLEAARLQASAVAGNILDHASAVREYAAAFREAGIGEETEAAEVVADRIRSRAVREQLVAAVDDWAVRVGKEEPPRATWMLAVARAVDPNPWRNRFRDAAVWNDRTALERLAREAKVSELSPQIMNALGMLLVKLNADAIPLLTAAQRRYPSDFWLNFSLGGALYNAQRWEEAISCYRAALVLRPAASAAYHSLGNALRMNGRVDEAIAEYQKAIELDPKYGLAHVNLGHALREKRRGDDGIAEYRKAIELDPKFAAAHVNLGHALRDMGRGDDAIAEYRKGIELDPKNGRAYDNLGHALRDMGRVDEAIAEYRKFIELDPKFAAAHYFLGLAMKAKGDLDGAERAFREAVRLDGEKHGDAIDALAELLLSRGNLKEAIATYQKIMILDPESASAHYHLGIALKAKGDLDEAIAAFEDVIRRQPDFTAAHFGLASALAEAKQWDRSASVYAAALKQFGPERSPGPWFEAIRSDEVFTRLTAEQPDDRLPRIMRARLHVLERDWKCAVAEYARVYESLASIDPAKLRVEGGDGPFPTGSCGGRAQVPAARSRTGRPSEPRATTGTGMARHGAA